MTTRYVPGGVSVSIGKSQEVQLPPRVLRGRCTCMHFDTDKAFLLPMSMVGIRNLLRFYQRNPGLTVLVNGHTDRVGDPAYNRTLSNERANAVAAYLQNRVDDWLAWYSAATTSKKWGTAEDQHMLATLLDAAEAPYYSGPITGFADTATQDAIRRFQTDKGLVVDGVAGPNTRRALVEGYMELDGTTLPASATLVVHGCGEAHPVDATEDADQGNRRVEIFLFDGPVQPPPVASCPTSGCAEYPIWVAQSTEEVDLCTAELFDVDFVVVDDRDPPQPVPEARVAISAPGVISVVADTQGRGVLRDTPAGTWEITATHADYPSKTQPITVPVAAPTVAPQASEKKSLVGAEGDGKDPPPSPTGGTVITLAVLKFDIEIEWGAESLKVQKSLTSGASGTSFWLTDTNAAGGPVAVHELAPISGTAKTGWQTAAPKTSFTVPKPGASATSVKVSIAAPKGALIRLDFDLKATIGSSTHTTLKLQQLFEVVDPGSGAGELSPLHFANDPYALAHSGTGQPAPTRTNQAAKTFAGTHRLVTMKSPLKIEINCEFVDCTELWWDLHAAGDPLRWYLEPRFGGRVTSLRVLAWTIGAYPMIWFVAIPSAAQQSLAARGTPAANIVFLRPMAGANTFFYALSKKGFEDKRHQTTSMFILARFLLTPAAPSQMAALTSAGVQGVERAVSQVQPTSAGPPPSPIDPMDPSLMRSVVGAFQLVGMEQAIEAVDQTHLLFLPLGTDAGGSFPEGGYNAVYRRKGIRASMEHATDLLWNIGAVAAAEPPPVHTLRQLWMGGHSAGNGILWQAITKAGAEIDRVISVSATGAAADLFTIGFNAMNAAAKLRPGGTIDAVLITAPDLKNKPHTTPSKTKGAPATVDYEGLVFADLAKHNLSTSVQVRIIPDLAAEPTYWQTSPVTSMNAFHRDLLAHWDVTNSKGANLIEESAKSPSTWFFLFFHEYAMFGGHARPGGRKRTFFQDALSSITSTNSATVKVFVQRQATVGGPFAPAGNTTVKVSGSSMARTATTGSDGRVEIDGLDPGTYQITADGQLATLKTATLVAGSNPEVVLEIKATPSAK